VLMLFIMWLICLFWCRWWKFKVQFRSRERGWWWHNKPQNLSLFLLNM